MQRSQGNVQLILILVFLQIKLIENTINILLFISSFAIMIGFFFIFFQEWRKWIKNNKI